MNRRLQLLMLIVVVCVGVSGVVLAQSGRQAISLENAAQLQQVAVLTMDGREMRFSPDSRFVAIANEGVHFFELATISDTSEPVFELADYRSFEFTHDGSKLLVLSDANGLQAYDLTGELSNMTPETIAAGAGSFVLSPSDGFVAIREEQTGRLIDLASGETVQTWQLPQGFAQMSFSPDETMLAINSGTCSPGNCNGAIRVLDLPTGEARFTTRVEDSYINAVQFSPDSTLLAYGASTTGSWSIGTQYGTTFENGVVHVVNLGDGTEVLTLENTQGVLGSLFFSPDNTRLAYSTITFLSQFPEWSSAVVHVVDLGTGEETTLAVEGLAQSVSPDWRRVYVSGTIILPGVMTFGGGSSLVDIASGTKYFEGSGFFGSSFAYSPDATLMAVSGVGSATLSIHDAASGEEVAALAVEGVERVSNLEFSPDGTLLGGNYTIEEQNYFILWGIP